MTRGRRGVVVVGAGKIAAAHIHAVQAVEGLELVGIASRSPERAGALAARHGVKGFASLEAALADPAVSIVAVCTPSGAHLEPAMQAVAAGKHVIVEKPLEVTVERATRLARAAEDAGVTLATIFMSRFADANAFVRGAVGEGRLGRLIQGNAYVPWYRDQPYYDSAAWRGTVELDGGGALMNQAIHQLDLLIWMMGDVEEVFAYAANLAHERIEVEDTLVASLRFANGALGHLSAATSLWPGRPKSLQIHGDRGMALLEDDMLVDWHVRDEPQEARAAVLAEYGGQRTGGSSDPLAISFENHRRQYAEFAAALAEGRPPALGGFEGVRAVEVIAAAYRSVAERRPVRPGA